MKIGILISGRGSNMVAIVDAVKSGEIPDSEVAVVISDKRDAPGLEKARSRGVETVVVERNGRSREEHDAEIAAELNDYGVELVCLAGYMRLLSREFVNAFPNRIINIHPSLLPDFPGLDAQRRALEAGAKYSGCTVHYVDENLDAGLIIRQQWVPIEKGDDVDSLSDRILTVEHRLYVEAIRDIAIEANAEHGRPGDSTRYKALKSLAHNLSHSFISLVNYVDDDYVIDELRTLVREIEDNKISINWLGVTEADRVFPPRVKKSISYYRQYLPGLTHRMGLLLRSIREFRTEIYLKPNHQMAVEGIIVDDRGRVYKAQVF